MRKPLMASFFWRGYYFYIVFVMSQFLKGVKNTTHNCVTCYSLHYAKQSSPTVSVTTIQRDLREMEFNRCSSSCINGLISPRRELQNMLFI